MLDTFVEGKVVPSARQLYRYLETSYIRFVIFAESCSTNRAIEVLVWTYRNAETLQPIPRFRYHDLTDSVAKAVSDSILMYPENISAAFVGKPLISLFFQGTTKSLIPLTNWC